MEGTVGFPNNKLITKEFRPIFEFQLLMLLVVIGTISLHSLVSCTHATFYYSQHIENKKNNKRSYNGIPEVIFYFSFFSLKLHFYFIYKNKIVCFSCVLSSYRRQTFIILRSDNGFFLVETKEHSSYGGYDFFLKD